MKQRRGFPAGVGRITRRAGVLATAAATVALSLSAVTIGAAPVSASAGAGAGVGVGTLDWSNITPPPSGPGNAEAQPVYDTSTSQLLLFQQTAAGSTTWDWTGSAWAVASRDQIGADTGPALVAYDESISQLVLVLDGGTYGWTGSDWSETAGSSPMSLAATAGDAGIGPGASLAFDPATAQLIEIQSETGETPVAFQTWSWDGTSWAELAPADSPPARAWGALAYDPVTPELVLFGGDGASGPLADTWTWDGTTWTEQAPTTSPSPRRSAGFQYDPASGQMLLFGGEGTPPGGSDDQGLADTWTWDGANWTALSTSTLPSLSPAVGAGLESVLAWDASTSQMVLYWGGTEVQPPSTAALQDTWSWDGTDWSDATPAPTSPDGGVVAGAAWDAATSQLIDVADGATYAWTGSAWDELTTAGPALYGILAYDAATSQLLWVEQGPSGSGPASTWVWDGSTWSQLAVATEPPTLAGASLAFDSTSDQLVYVGDLASGSAQTEETWTFEGTTWSQISTPTSPPASLDSSFAYDPATGGMLLYGGHVAPNGVPQTDTWLWSDGSWSQLSPATSPPREADAALAFDPDLDALLLIGNDNPSDTWTWNGATWSQLVTAQAPISRSLPGLAWDPATSQMLLVGGYEGGTARTAAADTWTLTTSAISTPTVTSVTAEGFAAALTWTPAALGAGVPLTGYTLTAYPSSGPVSPITVGNVLSYTYDGLTPGVPVQFTVTPLNGAGTYPASGLSAAATPLGTTGPPLGVTLTCGDGEATLAWQPPAPITGAAPVTGYELDSPSGALSKVGASTTSDTLTLANGTGAQASVEALNQYGPSPWVQTAQCTPYADVGTPSVTDVTPGDGQATVTWSPATPGDEPITGYEIFNDSNYIAAEVGPDVTSYTITGLSDDVACIVTVQAVDADGQGPPSPPYPPVVPEPAGEVPSVTGAAIGAGTVTLSWAPPKLATKSPLTAYRVRDSAGTVLIVNPTTKSVTFKGLKEGKQYTFTVAAERLTGTSPPSAARSVTVAVPPGLPQKPKATAGVKDVTFIWSPPASTGGDPISGYVVEVYDCAAGSNPCKQALVRTVTLGAKVLETVVGTLTGGKKYWLTVAAETAAGRGKPTAEVEATPKT